MTKQEILLAKIALKKKYITQQQLDECLRLQKDSERPKPLVILMIEQGYISDKELESIVQYQQKYQQKIQIKKEKGTKNKSEKSKKPEKTPENAYYCGFCNAPIKETDEKCPRCGAVFTTEESLNEQVYSCASCKNLVSLSDRKCPNCGAQFDD